MPRIATAHHWSRPMPGIEITVLVDAPERAAESSPGLERLRHAQAEKLELEAQRMRDELRSGVTDPPRSPTVAGPGGQSHHTAEG